MLLEKYSVFCSGKCIAEKLSQIILSVYLISEYLCLKGYIQFLKKLIIFLKDLIALLY